MDQSSWWAMWWGKLFLWKQTTWATQVNDGYVKDEKYRAFDDTQKSSILSLIKTKPKDSRRSFHTAQKNNGGHLDGEHSRSIHTTRHWLARMWRSRSTYTIDSPKRKWNDRTSTRLMGVVCNREHVFSRSPSSSDTNTAMQGQKKSMVTPSYYLIEVIIA